MGNKIAPPILDKEEATSRWNEIGLANLKETFEIYSNSQDNDRMSRSAFMNYVFPFIPKELVERLFVIFQLQVVDGTLKYNYRRNIKRVGKYIMEPSHPTNENENKSDDKKKRKKKKKISPIKVGKPPFLSFTITYDQFLIGMTIITHGSYKEKLLLLWRMFDIEFCDNLSYYDIQQILNILFKLETDFFHQKQTDLLHNLFRFSIPNDSVPITKEIDINKINENNETKETDINNYNDNDIDQLIESKMQDIKTTKTDSDETKMGENTELLKNDSMNKNKNKNNNNNNTLNYNDKNNDNDNDNFELEKLKEKTISFEHFYQWSKQYENNPFTSWLINEKVFPPPPIEPLPNSFSIEALNEIWQQYQYLCIDNNNIHTIVHNSKFSESEIIKIYCSWYNKPQIYEYNCGYFLTFEQFSNIFKSYIINNNSMDIVFKII
eukprot:338622_1